MSELYTIEQAKQWVEQHLDECMKTLREDKEIPSIFKMPGSPLRHVWLSGCWLYEKLEKAGASEEQISEIGFCHGQRSFGRDPYKSAVAYVNEFISTNNVNDKPGEKLAEKLFSKMVQESEAGDD